MNRSVTDRSMWLVRLSLALLVLFLLAFGLARADSTYVSLQGEFYFEYPEDWVQVDYLTVDYYLNAVGADSSAFQYDAVFAANKPGRRFHDNEYVIVTVEPVGNLTQRERDSVVAELADSDPQWDKQNHTVTVIDEDPTSPKASMFVMKFYNKGLAQFYFFAPDSTFADYQPVFNRMVASFSTENVSAMLPKEEVRLADPDRTTGAAPAESVAEESDSGASWLPFGGIAAVIIVVIIVLARSRKKSAQA